MVRWSHFVAQRASSAVWGKGRHRAAGAQGLGERACGTSLVWRPWLGIKTAFIVKMV